MASRFDQIHSLLNISGTDYDQIRDNIKTFLRSQDQFASYDLDSSAISVFIDMMAYTTFYNSYYLNQTSAESYLEFAQLRDNVVSLAKNVGYIPRSVNAARAIVQVQFFPDNSPLFLTIPEGTTFTSQLNGTTFPFRTTDTFTVERSQAGEYIVELPILQGTRVQQSFTVDTQNINQRFLLQNSGIDHGTIRVSVQNSFIDTMVNTYERNLRLTELTPQTRAFFVEEAEEGYSEVKFGNGTIGRGVDDGNIVRISYLVSQGSGGNGASQFTLVGNISGIRNFTVATIQSAVGGRDVETLDEIRENASRSFQSQNRLVTIQDFTQFIKSNVSDVEGVAAWGGEDNEPPLYGNVFLSLKPAGRDTYSNTEKRGIVRTIQNSSVVTVNPVIVDPNYTFLPLQVTVRYAKNRTAKTAGGLTQVVRNSLALYNREILQSFGSAYRESDLTSRVVSSDQSFSSAVITPRMGVTFIPTVGISYSNVFQLRNEIFHPNDGHLDAITSSSFSYRGDNNMIVPECRLDDLDGIVRVIREVAGSRVVVSGNVGAVNYTTGELRISSFFPTSFEGDSIRISITPKNRDIVPVREQILILNSEEVNITLISE